MPRTVSTILKKIGRALLALILLAAVGLLLIKGVMNGHAECLWTGTAQAFVDTNSNGTRDQGEPPLAGVAFRVDDPYNHVINATGRDALISDGAGKARLWVDLPGCPHAEFEIYVQAPDGYTLTSPQRIRAGSQSDQTFPFGFAPTKPK